MKRRNFKSRENYTQKNEELGFDFGVIDNLPYWEEETGYEITTKQALDLEMATEKLIEMSFDTIDYVIKNNKFDLFNIPDYVIPLIKSSWEKEEWSFFGRFDFWYDGKEIKVFEYNADTPTSLLEASLVQYHWMLGQEQKDQFNSIHEKMIEYWDSYNKKHKPSKIYFSCVKENLEDYRNTEYIMDCASQAGINTEFIFIDDIGSDGDHFFDLNDERIEYLFKLYPWEWMVEEDNISIVLKGNCNVIEPIWKMLLSNKALMAVMYELFPDSPYLLPCYFSPEKLGSEFVEKPLLSREGQNVVIKTNQISSEKDGNYKSDKNVYQQVKLLPDFDGFHPVIGSWVIGESSAGIGIREDEGYITGNLSKFVSHYIKD